jgi:tetratricopeptide (TPR) repeat protein
MRTVLVTLGLGFAAPLVGLGLATPLVGDGLPASRAQEFKVLRWTLVALAHAGQAGPSTQTTSAHTMPMVPSELLVRPIDVRTHIGRAHDAIEGISPEAQTYYDQGLSYLHNYVWIEAARSFNQALRLDSRLALAYVGLSVAHDELNQRAAAHDTLERARRLEPSSAHERRHLVVRERQLAAEDAPQNKELLSLYRKELDAALVEFPGDVEFWLQRGVAEASDPGDRGQSSPASAVSFYEHAVQLVPDHFAAHHYLTHAFENSGRINEALTQGGLYAGLASDVPHARHMYGHNLRRVGRVQEAILEFEAADGLETAYFAREHIEPDNDWHYEHNLDLLGTSYQYVGQIHRATPLLEKAFGLATANLVQAVNKREWPMFLRATAQPDAALVAARALIAHPNLVVQAIGHIEAAHVLIARGQTTEGATEGNAAVAALKKAPAGGGLASIPMQVLQGEFFLRTGQREKARATLNAAIVRARAAQGPDDWAQALFTLESVARAAREAGDWELAGTVATQMIAHDTSYGGSHYARALVDAHNGNNARAATEFALAERLWNIADPDFPPLADIRSRLRAQK